MLPAPCWEEGGDHTLAPLPLSPMLFVCGRRDYVCVPHSHASFLGEGGGVKSPDLAVGADRKSGGLQFDVSPLSARAGFQRISTWSRKGLLPS